MSAQIGLRKRFLPTRSAHVGTLALVALFAAGNLLLTPLGGGESDLWSDLGWALASGLSGRRCFSVAAVLRGPERRAWQLFGLGCLAWFAGIIYWDFLELVLRQETPFPALSDLGFLAFAPLFAAGLIFYRSLAPSASYTLMEVSQVGIFIACIVVVHIVIFYAPASQRGMSGLYLVTALAYPVLYMALLVQALSRLFMTKGIDGQRPLILILLGIVLQALTNSWYAYSTLGRAYQAGALMDIGWVLGFALIYSAAEQRLRQGPRPSHESQPSARLLRLSGVVPALTLLVTLSVVMLFRDRLQPEMIGVLQPVAFALVILLGLREWAGHTFKMQVVAAEQVSEAKLRQLAHVAPVGILRLDRHGSCYYANDYIEEMSGLPASSHLGRGWLRVLHPDDRSRVEKEWLQNSLVQGPYGAEYRLLRSDGSELWVVGQVAADRGGDGSIAGYIASFTDITVRRRADQALRESERRFRMVFDTIPAMVSISHLETGRFINVNDTFVATSGFRRDEIIGRTSHELGLWVAPDDRGALIKRLRDEGRIADLDWRMRTKSGDIRVVLGSFEAVSLGGEPCLLVIGQDITERRQAELRMKKLSGALEQAADAVMITDCDGVIEYVNHAFVATTGYQVEEVIGRRPNILSSAKQPESFFREMWHTILAGKVFSEVFINKRKDGSLYYEEKTITPLKDGTGAVTHFISTGHDITERIQTQERLQYLAHHDLLTGLPNRSLFIDRLKQALAYARWHQRLVAVLFVDIDRFKNINDSLGHDLGDQLLRAIAVRLETCLRDRDTVARFGGDEFVLVLNDIATSADVSHLAKKILELMRPAFKVNGHTLHVTASIGVSLFPGDGDEVGELLSRADTAMYRAKDTGRNQYQFYSNEMGARAFERLSMENSLRLAMERNEFVLHYQPQIDARDGRIFGVEALLRWCHPERGLISPLEFIPLLEDTGMIVPVGEWVLQNACRQLGEWHKAGHQRLRMAVNLSSLQFGSPVLLQVIHQVLAENGLKPDHLELEITESILMRRDGSTASMLQALDEMGVRLGLDDFGTGYSSLSYLRSFPIETLKIDRSFVRDVPDDPEDAAIIQAIVVMGTSLKLELIAEGVETPTQAAYLQSLGCHLMQGFLFSAPLAADRMTARLQARG